MGDIIKTAQCRFCGQMVQIETDKELTQPQAEEQATCTSCDQYKNRTEAYKTDEQRYSEEQDAIDRETKKKLREMEQEEKMQKLPSTAPEEIKTIRVSQDKFEEYTGEYRKPYMITKDDGFKVGNVVKLVVFAAGKATGETADMRITCKDDDITCSGLSDGWCVIGLGEA